MVPYLGQGGYNLGATSLEHHGNSSQHWVFHNVTAVGAVFTGHRERRRCHVVLYALARVRQYERDVSRSDRYDGRRTGMLEVWLILNPAGNEWIPFANKAKTGLVLGLLNCVAHPIDTLVAHHLTPAEVESSKSHVYRNAAKIVHRISDSYRSEERHVGLHFEQAAERIAPLNIHDRCFVRDVGQGLQKGSFRIDHH